MNIFKQLPTHTFLVLTIFSVLLVTSCDDNPASSNDEEEHTDPEGLELVHDGEVIFEYTGGELTEHSHLHFHAGEEYLFEVHFLNENGEHVHSEDLGDGYFLEWNIENEDVLEIHQHEEDGPWAFHLEAIAEGASKVQFGLMHNREDPHSHLETPAIDQEDAIEFHVDADSDGEHQH